ncbi:phosphoadenosine phosphosulfate reductase family protein [Clostridium paraputrificum]|uniref:phosphoadenosine phosphosulfate reductase domain-containing protein n=1 Tax=Clostridium paraputrificum TaxID=29363 RepID=UPI00189E1DEB|nr:phosphoadenosine phosphosulfate reductase family protein [Clostridium paraputrificum]MDB2116838.1 phosphoadenosine phosphosulfate reductase family protein [Clostridium paraputrificum]
MIKYYCNNCKVEMESSECSICGERTQIKSQLYWCKECNVPMYESKCLVCNSKGKLIGTDLRPVFPEERLLLEILINEPFKFKEASVWNTSGNRYIVDGTKLRYSQKDLMKMNPDEVISKLKEYSSENNYEVFDKYIRKFIEVNQDRYNFLVTEATNFIINQKKSYKDDETFVSFSGGKDSTVVSDLVIRALGMPSIIHIFGDTTLEFPMTEEYADRFRKAHKKTPFLSARNKEKNFYDMCEVVGPPSRVMRWCCTVFKTGAITKRINTTFKDKKKILTFYGIRRSESASRNKYDRVSDSPKIAKQNVSSPIIDWYDFDVWLYLVTTGIDFNYAYRLGYTRVGCWCCPNNTSWAQYLAQIYMPEQAKAWRNQLIKFAVKIGKPDPEVYIDDGKWKARQGGNGVDYSENVFVSFKPCANENESFNYQLNKPISEELYEFFKPFGWINKEMGNSRLGEVYVVDKVGNPIIRLQGKIGSKELKVTALKVPLGKARSLRDIRQRIDCQLTKYQLCLGCLGCESACKHNAIIVKKPAHENEIIQNKVNDTYRILDDRCVRCGECINHFDGGCYMRKVLITKRGDR